jgi:hypothetical protein
LIAAVSSKVPPARADDGRWAARADPNPELDPAVQEQIVEALADWADDSDDPMPLARALADGDLLGGREPPSVPPTVRNRIGEALTAAIGNDEPDRG